MSLRVVCVGVAMILLAGCSAKGPKTADEPPERIRSESEVIRSVDAEPAPVTAPTQPAPRVASAPRSTGALMAPMAGRVGIMTLLGNELSHVHSGTLSGHKKDYNVQYDFNGYVVEELRKALLSKTPYQPVMVASTGALRQAARTWQNSVPGGGFAPTLQREFDGILKQNRLAMLIVVGYATVGDGQIGGRELSGCGLYTRSRFGNTSTAVFCTLQFYRLVGTPARLVRPIAPDDDRSIGDLPNVKLPEDLDDLPPRYLVPVYGPMRTIVQNKVAGLISLPRKLGY